MFRESRWKLRGYYRIKCVLTIPSQKTLNSFYLEKIQYHKETRKSADIRQQHFRMVKKHTPRNTEYLTKTFKYTGEQVWCHLKGQSGHFMWGEIEHACVRQNQREPIKRKYGPQLKNCVKRSVFFYFFLTFNLVFFSIYGDLFKISVLMLAFAVSLSKMVTLFFIPNVKWSPLYNYFIIRKYILMG